jgi:hypothetical protein
VVCGACTDAWHTVEPEEARRNRPGEYQLFPLLIYLRFLTKVTALQSHKVFTHNTIFSIKCALLLKKVISITPGQLRCTHPH